MSWLRGSRGKGDFESFQVSLILLPGYPLVLGPINHFNSCFLFLFLIFLSLSLSPSFPPTWRRVYLTCKSEPKLTAAGGWVLEFIIGIMKVLKVADERATRIRYDIGI